MRPNFFLNYPDESSDQNWNKIYESETNNKDKLVPLPSASFFACVIALSSHLYFNSQNVVVKKNLVFSQKNNSKIKWRWTEDSFEDENQKQTFQVEHEMTPSCKPI